MSILCWVYPLNNRSKTDERVPNFCQGHAIDVLLLLKENLNVDIYLYDTEGGKYGSSNINGTWNGLI